MVRISVDLINDSNQFINAVQQREICLRNRQIPTIENLGVTRDQFDVIDLSDNNIRSIDNLPQLKRLETLLLHNNRVQQIDKKIHEYLPKLSMLALTNNNLTELGDIDSLAKCSKLQYLSLIGNPITHLQYYRPYVIYKLKNVRVLDFRRIRQHERDEAIKLFKGKQGEQLRRQVVKHSEQLVTGEDEANVLAKAKGRTQEEQERIKSLIGEAKTLAEVENIHALLQSGKLPARLGQAGSERAAGNGGFAPEEEEENEMDQS